MAMRLEIVTAERVLYEGDAEVVVIPGIDGEVAVLPKHAALMTVLQAGELRFRVAEIEHQFVVTGGFAEVRGNQVSVLADAAEHVDEIDESRAEEAARRAQERISSTGSDIDMERALRSLRRAQIRVSISRRRRRRVNQATIQN